MIFSDFKQVACLLHTVRCPLTDRLIKISFLYENSDKSIAAFLETAGEFLEELSLNNVKKVCIYLFPHPQAFTLANVVFFML